MATKAPSVMTRPIMIAVDEGVMMLSQDRSAKKRRKYGFWREDEGSARPAMAGGMRQEMTSTPGTDEVQLLVDRW